MEKRNEILNDIRVAINTYKNLVCEYNTVVENKSSIWEELMHRNSQIALFKRKIKRQKRNIKMLHRELSEFDSTITNK